MTPVRKCEKCGKHKPLFDFASGSFICWDCVNEELTSLRTALQTARTEGMEEGRHEGRIEALNAVFQINGPSRAIARLKEKYALDHKDAIPAPAEGCRGVYFVTLMRRWGNIDGHTYPAGVHLTLEEAIKRGGEEKLDRAGKYEFQVWQGDNAGGVIVHDTCGDQTEHWQGNVEESLPVTAIPAAEVCEWEIVHGAEWLANTDCGQEHENSADFKFCPYCGRPIKVA